MNKKRGFLLSLIIIMGLLILIIAIIAFAARNQLSSIISPKASDITGVQIYVENCIDAVAKYSAYRVGKQGGSIFLRHGHFSAPFLETNYAFDNVKRFPELGEIQREMEQFISGNLKKCTAEFRGFALQGISVEEAGDVSAQVIFGARSTLISVIYPLRITYEDKTFALERFQKDIPVTLKKIHSDTDRFLGISPPEDGYDLLFLGEMDANVYIAPFGESDLFVQERLDSRMNAGSYLFIFAVR